MADSAAFEPVRRSSDHVPVAARVNEPATGPRPGRPRLVRGLLRPSQVPVPGPPAWQAGSGSPVGQQAYRGPEALRPSGTGPGGRLPDEVRGRMERAFGSSFEDVRIHEGSSAAAEIGAQALTAGSDIHFAPGALRTGPAGDKLLGHELAHVVQQRQGRVAPTAQASGMPLNLDGRLEREADEQATRAAQGERTGGPPTGPVAVPRATAQGKFGFEFQTSNNFVASAGIPIVGEKHVAFEDTAKKFRVEGDEGPDKDHFNVEFITAALTTVAEAKTAIEGAAALAADLARGGPMVTRAEREVFDSGAWKRPAAIEVADPEFRARPQASVGVQLADIPWLLELNLFNTEEDTLIAVGERAKAIKLTPAWKVASPDTSYELSGFLQLIVYYIQAARQPNRVDKENPRSFPDLGYQLISSDGPKVMFAVMARTDFHSIFNALSPGDQKIFITGLIGDVTDPEPNPELERIIGVPLSDPMIPAPYRADRAPEEDRQRFRIEMLTNQRGDELEIVTQGPTILDWLLSIVTGHSYKDAKPYAEKKRDMLSAPVGWGSRAPGARGFPTPDEIVAGEIYGMGAYPIDETESGNLAVFELRNLSTNLGAYGDPSYDEWWAAAVMAIRLELLKAGHVNLPKAGYLNL